VTGHQLTCHAAGDMLPHSHSQARELGVTQAPLRMDSQVKYGLLSRGEASIFMRFPPPTYKCVYRIATATVPVP
jgi:3'-phosphoadenosine 5'-phosphosulfate (PAPS) 3'-phosphatase